MTSTVRKAVIPAAGLGTRFLPATKALAKENVANCKTNQLSSLSWKRLLNQVLKIFWLSLVNQNVLLKTTLTQNFELEYNLKEKGKHDLLKLGRRNNWHSPSLYPSKPSSWSWRCCLTSKSFCGE